MKEISKAYKCDYCNRVSISKYGMSLHENACNKNPKNRTYCYDCAYSNCKMKEYCYDVSDPYYGEEEELIDKTAYNAPYCDCFNKFLIAPKLARANYFNINENIEMLMPTEAQEKCKCFTAK